MLFPTKLCLIAEDIVCDSVEQTHSGFLQSVEVGFEDLTMTLQQKKTKTERLILDGSIRGVAKPGRMVSVKVMAVIFSLPKYFYFSRDNINLSWKTLAITERSVIISFLR